MAGTLLDALHCLGALNPAAVKHVCSMYPREIGHPQVAPLRCVVVQDTYAGMSESAVEVLRNLGLRVPKIWRRSPASTRMV